MDPDFEAWDWRNPATATFSIVVGESKEQSHWGEFVACPRMAIDNTSPLPMGVGGPVLKDLAELVEMVEATTEAAKSDIQPSFLKKLLLRDPSVFEHMKALSTYMEILSVRATDRKFFHAVDARRIILSCDAVSIRKD